ncbi:dual specificity tyrosine-phosphorylation-regulated kinase 1B-like isoform X2 [Sparus aurata]|uniref:dual specificity tyrosine-phosphorylation-regulated kinase 1B-like isoform X2 n=1 Tax=Sparus aurata TaxID=8175 RepID=UPI0011C1A146|nr:dual specificity tyrosine-phosphorylation-regulated kinase 1B-like isoform X2 [Sparus aurata]
MWIFICASFCLELHKGLYKKPCLFVIPEKYNYIRQSGEGGFSVVVNCINRETFKIVSIKIPKGWNLSSENEIEILETIMYHNLDKCNIVKYIEHYPAKYGPAIVFERLDISLYEYMDLNKFAPMLLSDIRTIIQQLATAFDALKGIGVIHTDVKWDNIMMDDGDRRPFKVKLIDFGLAIPMSKAKKYRGAQPFQNMPPEVFLSGEFTEASDMWSLGCVMFQMICGFDPFIGHSKYETMLEIVELLGKPADHLLDKCDRAKKFFTKTDGGVWRIKTPWEFYKLPHKLTKYKHGLKCLDELKAMRLEEENNNEAVEREQCIELLKAMLAFDADERITPCEILTHPFIRGFPNVQTLSEDFKWKLPAADLDDEDSSNIQPDDCTPSSEILSSGAFLVWSYSSTENSTLLEDQESTVSEPTAASLRDDESSNIQPDDCTPSPEIVPSGAILVLPHSSTENSTLLEDQESTVSEPTAAPLRDEDSSNIQPDDCTPSPEILPSGAILVLPHSSTENSTLLEDQEIPVSFQSGVNKTSQSSVNNTDSNRKTSDDSTTCDDGPKKKGKKKKNCFRPVVSWLRKTFLCRVQTLSEDFKCEPPAAAPDGKDSSNIQPGDCPPSPEILPSGVILVRPATAENTTLLEDQESTVSEPTAAPLRDEESSIFQPDDCTPSPEILPSGVILVRPATAENTTLLEDQ